MIDRWQRWVLVDGSVLITAEVDRTTEFETSRRSIERSATDGESPTGDRTFLAAAARVPSQCSTRSVVIDTPAAPS